MLLQPVAQLVVRRDQCSLGRLTLYGVSHAGYVLSCMTLLIFWHFACSHECTTRDVTGFRPVSGEPLAQSEYMPQFQAPRSWTLCPLGFVAACSGSLALLLHVLAVLSYSIILSSNRLNWNRFKSNYLGLGGA